MSGLSELVSKKFVCHQVSGRVEVSGSVHDSTDLYALKTLIGSPCEISLRSLGACTWNGFRKLLDLLAERQCFDLFGVPYHVYDDLKLLVDPASTMRVQDVLLPKLLGKGGMYEFEAFEQVPYADLVGESAARFVTSLDSTRLRLLRDKDQNPHAGNRALAVIGDYLAFQCHVFNMIARQIAATNYAFEECMGRLEARVKNVITVARLMGLQFARPNVVTEIRDAHSYAAKLVSGLMQVVEQLQLNVAQCIHSSESEFSAAAVRGVVIARRILAAKQYMEEAGVKLGGALRGVDDIRDFEREIDRINPSDFDRLGIATSVKAALDVMDPLLGDNWDDVAVCIRAELNAIKLDQLDGMVLTQGFDLARQLLEHREMEIAAPWVNSIEKGIGEVTDIHLAELIEIANRRIVTDQESFSFRYYLSRWAEVFAIKKKEAEADPGDVLLF